MCASEIVEHPVTRTANHELADRFEAADGHESMLACRVNIAEVLLEPVVISNGGCTGRYMHKVNGSTGGFDGERSRKRQRNPLRHLNAASALHIFPGFRGCSVKIVSSRVDQCASSRNSIVHDRAISQRS